jgi:hypothetical protein
MLSRLVPRTIVEPDSATAENTSADDHHGGNAAATTVAPGSGEIAYIKVARQLLRSDSEMQHQIRQLDARRFTAVGYEEGSEGE